MKGSLSTLLLSGLLGACTPVPVVHPQPVPSAEKLRPEDCPLAAAAYQRHLAAPGAAARWPTVDQFRTECQSRLAGRVRRVVLRCWHDAPNAAVFLSCNERF
ncbi:MAG: hypothetical protein RMK29_19230 [Myxococcales bacterium]|nr:hypothetical protein [Myxococcota bacterium]MDW8283839.1 hypothetical protein [Myxococcales bacterium]